MVHLQQEVVALAVVELQLRVLMHVALLVETEEQEQPLVLMEHQQQEVVAVVVEHKVDL
jgi:hypothetical protein